jgi:PAS domain S-box-containing protein
LFLDVTARKRAEAELWEGQHRKNYLGALGDRMRELHRQEDIEQAACEGLCLHLALGQMAVLDTQGEDQAPAISSVWPPGSTLLGQPPHTLDALGDDYHAALRLGRTTYLAPLLGEAGGEIRPWAIVVPLRRWGRHTGAMLACPASGSRLKNSDIAFLEEVAERMCGAVERSQYSRMLEQRVEDAIAERDRIWRLSPELLAVVDRQGRFVSVNPAVRPILGWTPEQFMSLALADLIHPDDLAATLAAWGWSSGDAGPRPGARHLENRLLKREGGYCWVTWSMSWTQDSLYMTGRDDTDLKLQAEALRDTENALRQSQKMEAVGRLTGGIAHDFNNMLQGISGALYLVQRKITAGAPEQALRFVDVAMDSANRAAHLTQRLLTFSRRQPIDPKPFCVASALQSMVALFHRYTGERVALRLDLPQELWAVCCDKNQFENAMLNLVINACDAMPNGGALTVAARNVEPHDPLLSLCAGEHAGRYVEVSVTDVGCGMPPDVLAHAFDPFFTTKPLGQGTGLGLSMIYGFARQAGGAASLESTVDVGTTVRLFLPRYDGAPESVQDGGRPAAATPGAARKEVVLVVEDDANVREMVRECLAELGLEVLTAVDGEAGLDLLQSARGIDLLITDVGLPGLNGRQLADAARVARPGLRVLLMTGYAESAARGQGFLEQGLELIVKPFQLDKLTERVQGMLDSAPGRPGHESRH